ncbi:MAG: ABC transporter substrate-binding protein [Thermomicrobiales bacterium]
MPITTLTASWIPVPGGRDPEQRSCSVAEDQSSVTWKLREGVVWHDGEPLPPTTSFTSEYLSDPATNATTLGFYSDIDTVEALDDYTVQINFKNPVAAWFNPPVGALNDPAGAHSPGFDRNRCRVRAIFNLMPIGTGPFKAVEFNPVVDLRDPSGLLTRASPTSTGSSSKAAATR